MVHVGGHIDFVAADGRGTWSVENAAIVTINGYTGRAVAESVGDGIVHYNEKLKHSARVKVFAAVKISAAHSIKYQILESYQVLNKHSQTSIVQRRLRV